MCGSGVVTGFGLNEGINEAVGMMSIAIILTFNLLILDTSGDGLN